MRWLRRFCSIVRVVLFPRRREKELEMDAESWYELLVDEKLRLGLPPDQARREARLEWGGTERLKCDVRGHLPQAA